jgi:hypothetical protein
MTDMGSVRSTKLHDVKSAAYKIFEPQLAGYITSCRTPGYSGGPNIMAQELLGFKPRDIEDPKSKDTYTTKPPFIFAEGTAPQATRVFRVESIAKVSFLSVSIVYYK